MSIEQTISLCKYQKNKTLKDKVYILTSESNLIQQDQYHHPQKEAHI